MGLAGIGYRHVKELGGRRGRQNLGRPSPNGFWRNDSFRNYADYALTPAFGATLAELFEWRREHRCAIICAEAAWQRCHRQIIADWLIATGADVRHIVDAVGSNRHGSTPARRLRLMAKSSIRGHSSH